VGNNESKIKARIAQRIAEIREQIAALRIEHDALIRVSGGDLETASAGAKAPSGVRSAAAESARKRTYTRDGEARITLPDQVMALMTEHRDSTIKRAGLVDLVAQFPSLAHVADPKKSAQTVVARLIREERIIESADGWLYLPQDVQLPAL